MVLSSCNGKKENFPADLKDLPRASADLLEKLGGRVVADSEGREVLVMGEKRKIPTRVYGGDLVRSPYSGTECVYYKAEVSFKKSDGDHFIGNDSSANTLYAVMGGHLVAVEGLEAGFGPTAALTLSTDNIPSVLTHHLEQKGLLEEVRQYPQMTVEEWCFKPGQNYLVTVTRHGSALPPKEPGGEPTYVIGYTFHFE